jgi:glutamate transport system substrate-binding protein
VTRSRLAIGAVAGALALGGLSLGHALAATQADHKTVDIGIKFDQPGLGLMGTDGKPQGFDVDVATYVARYLGYSPDEIRWVDAASSDREKLIEDGKVDFVVASYSMTPEREKVVSFAGPYFVAGQSVMVQADNKDITGADTLNGKTVCAATGSDSGPKILDFSPKAHLVYQPSYSDCATDLLNGKVDAVTTDDVILAGYVAANPGKLKMVGHVFTKERYGIGIKHDDVTLQGTITDAIEKMIETGTWQKDVDATIGTSGYKTLPPPPVFNAPADDQVVYGDKGAEPALVAAASDLITASNAHRWKELDELTCPSLRGNLDNLVQEFSPEYDTNLGNAVDQVGFHNELLGVQQTGPATGLIYASEHFTHVPVKYDEYFKDITYFASLALQHGSWRMCGLAANFDGG